MGMDIYSASSAMDLKDALILNGVSARAAEYRGKPALEVTMPASSYQDPQKEQLMDRSFMAWLPADFRNGAIEIEMAGVLAADAPAYARGFIGLTFRVDADLRFESIYLRPTNGRCDDQVRRNHSIQYVAQPGFDFNRLRREAPERYESYVDIGPDEWIHMRIELQGTQARAFINHARQPSLIVSDLKLGADQQGGIGFWIESGTVGYFGALSVEAFER